MKFRVKAAVHLCAFSYLLTMQAGLRAQAIAPRILYTDLDSGPNTGGEGNLGAFVSIYGQGFGSASSSASITFGGGAAQIISWTNTRIIVQLGSSSSSGSIVVNTSTGVSNPVEFTVRSGNIYFVATTGNDSSDGSFLNPWLTLLKARRAIVAGDIVYVRNGVAQKTDDGEGWRSCLTIGAKSGTAAQPIALIVYPNETATIGDIDACESGIRSKGQEEHFWTIAGFQLRGKDEALTTYGVTGWRIIGNDMTCPKGNGASACYETNLSTYLKVYGNNVHDSGASNASALYQGVYFSTDSNHIDFGWNTIANIRGCRGLQIHSSPLTGGGQNDPTGHDQFDLKIHDNFIHDTQCDGIILATVDPSKGSVEVFNNVIMNTGKGPNNPERSGSWSCIHVQGYTNSGPPGSGTIHVYNNVLYGCGTFANPSYKGGNAAIFMSGPNASKRLQLVGNIVVLLNAIPYISADDGSNQDCDNCSRVYGSSNLFFGSGVRPKPSARPLFVF